MDQQWPSSWNKDWQKLRDTAITTGSVGLGVTILRVVARKRKTNRPNRKQDLSWDDWLSFIAEIPALLISVTDFVFAIYMTSTSPNETLQELACWVFYATHFTWILTHGLASFSVLAHYSRHFGVPKKIDGRQPEGSRKIDSWIKFLRKFVILWTIGSILWAMFGEGLPLSRYCTVGPNERYKIRIINTSAFHFFINFLILITPIPWIIPSMNEPLERCLIILIYSLGWITMVFSGVRFYYLLERLHKPESEGMHYKLMAVMWSIIEINTSITLISLPTLMPIVDWCLDRYQTLDEHMAKASHGIEVTDGMLRRETKPREPIETDLPAEEQEAARLIPQQAPQLPPLVRTAPGQPLGFERTSSGSLQEWRNFTQLRIANP